MPWARQHWLLIALVACAVAAGLLVALLPTTHSYCLGGGPGELTAMCVHDQPDWLAGGLAGIVAYFIGVAFALSVRVLSKTQ